ncbi:hypothetical protein CLS_23480 [[Clostridium] cf. saccharolyticum K10]|nr:hypothetical protein CLS_23480 [[Clostridium] cf. saccharolyticum K10]
MIIIKEKGESSCLNYQYIRWRQQKPGNTTGDEKFEGY